jgi:hypothetical protein
VETFSHTWITITIGTQSSYKSKRKITNGKKKNKEGRKEKKKNGIDTKNKWWLAQLWQVTDWCLLPGGWWLVAGGWWLVAGDWWLVVAGGGWHMKERKLKGTNRKMRVRVNGWVSK